MIIVYTSGVFDLLHPGHINLLKRARSLGDKLIVGVQEDESVLKQKGKTPILNTKDRVILLESLKFVDSTITYSDLDQSPILAIIKPDIFVHGEDWQKTADRTKIMNFINDNGIRLVQFPYTKDVSSTTLKERLIDH